MAIIKEPVYQQLNQELRELIRKGEYSVGEKFLTEREIASLYEVSRATANKALSNLVSEGLLDFKKGIGTFVSEDQLAFDLRNLVSFTQKVKAIGKLPTTTVLKFDKIDAAECADRIVESLGLNKTNRLWYIERVRLIDCEPVIYEYRYIPLSVIKRLDKLKLEGSLYELIKEKHKINIIGADQFLTADKVSAAEAKQLKVKVGEPVLVVEGTGIGEKTPVWYERTLYRSDIYKFHNRLSGYKDLGPAVGNFNL